MTKTIIPTIATPAPLDVRLLPGGKHLLSGVSDEAVRALGAAAATYLAENPGATRRDLWTLQHRLWERVRGVKLAGGGTLEQALAAALRPALHDLGEVLSVLLEAGDLRGTLRAQRDAIDRQLAALEGIGARD